jgi:hypothetical protein
MKAKTKKGAGHSAEMLYTCSVAWDYARCDYDGSAARATGQLLAGLKDAMEPH